MNEQATVNNVKTGSKLVNRFSLEWLIVTKIVDMSDVGRVFYFGENDAYLLSPDLTDWTIEVA